ncbi:MAG: flagellar biosynthetic protein FliO [Pseudomonas sp.]
MITFMMAEAAAAAGAGGSATLGVGAVIEMLLWLGVVIVLILLCAWMYRRTAGGAFTAHGVIRIRSVTSLGNRERLALVQVGDKQILLGVSPGRINTLHVFDEDVVGTNAQPGVPASGSFAARLQGMLKRDGEQ